MCRIGDEDTACKIGPAGSHEVATCRERIFAERPVRPGATFTLLAAKGARARAKHAQRDDKGLTRYVACVSDLLLKSIFLQLMDTEEADIAQLCAQNIVLWQHFLEAFSGREAVHQHLARIHHQLRVRQFTKALKLKTRL